MSTGSKFGLLLVCVFAICFRLVFLIPAKTLNHHDSEQRYNPQSRNLLDGNGFSRKTSPPYDPEITDMPGYAIFLASLYKLGNFNLRFVMVIQAMLEILTILFLWLTTGLLGLPTRARWFAVVFALICPLLPRFNREILTEILATFLTTVAVYFSLLARKTDRSVNWCIAGVLWASALTVRGDLLSAMIPMVITLIIITRQIAKPALLVFVICLSLLPWTVRNYRVSGEILPFGEVFTQTKIPYVRWLDTWVTDYQQEREYCHRLLPDPKIDYSELSRIARGKDPFRVYVIVPLIRVARVWWNQSSHLPAGYKWILPHFFAYAPIVVGVFGMLESLFHRRLIMLVPFSVIAGRSVLAFASCLGVEPRYMLEAMPQVFIFAGLGLHSLLSLRNSESNP